MPPLILASGFANLWKLPVYLFVFLPLSALAAAGLKRLLLELTLGPEPRPVWGSLIQMAVGELALFFTVVIVPMIASRLDRSLFAPLLAVYLLVADGLHATLLSHLGVLSAGRRAVKYALAFALGLLFPGLFIAAVGRATSGFERLARLPRNRIEQLSK